MKEDEQSQKMLHHQAFIEMRETMVTLLIHFTENTQRLELAPGTKTYRWYTLKDNPWDFIIPEIKEVRLNRFFGMYVAYIQEQDLLVYSMLA